MWRVPRKTQGRAVKCASRPINSHRMKRCHFFFFPNGAEEADASPAPRPNLRRMPTTVVLAHQTVKESAARRDSKSTTPQHKRPMLLYFWAYSDGPVFFLFEYIWIPADIFFSGINRRKVLPLKLLFFSGRRLLLANVNIPLPPSAGKRWRC